MKYKACDPDTLQAYLRGDLDDESCSLVEAHAIECDNCRSVIELDLAGVAGALKSAVPEYEVPTTVNSRVDAIKRRGSWVRFVAAFNSLLRGQDGGHARAPEDLAHTVDTDVIEARPAAGYTRNQFLRQILTTGGLVGGAAASVGAYGLDRYKQLEARVALITLNFPRGTFNPADDLNEVNLVVEAPGSRTPVVLRRTVPVVGDRALLPALPGGLIQVAAEKQPGVNRPPVAFYWQGRAFGEMGVSLPIVRPGDPVYETATSLLRGVSHAAAEMNLAEIELQRRTFVCYRDIKLKIDNENVFSEDFSQVEENGRPASMKRYWAGYQAAVSRSFGAPAFVLEFLPNDNEGWIFPLSISRSASSISFSVEIMTPDSSRGGTFGLYGMLGALNAFDVCEIEFKNGDITLERQLLVHAEPWHWYTVEVTYHAQTARADVIIDGVPVANGVNVPGGHIDGLMISGVNYAIKGVDVP